MPNLPLGSSNGQTDLLTGTTTIVVVTVESSSPATAVLLVVGESQYVLSPNSDGTFSGTIPTPAADDVLSAVAVLADQSQTAENVAVDVVGSGSVYEVINGLRALVPGAVVTVYDQSRGVEMSWNAVTYNQTNPVLAKSGYFSWYVPNGTYRVYASKAGYEDGSATVRVTNNILVTDIELVRQPEVLVPDETRPTPIIQSARDWLDQPLAGMAVDIAGPLSLALAAGSLAALTLGFNLLTFLQYLFTAPLLLFGKKKRNTFGIVYNGITKVPIGLAIVRVYRVTDYRLMKSVVTSPEGRYSLTMAPGDYRLEVTKPGFVFPSKYLAGAKVDGNYLDVYTGQTLTVTDREALIAANIPLDPSEAEAYHAPRSLALRRFARSLQTLLAFSGLILSVVVLIIQPSLAAGALLVIQILVMLLVLKLVRPKKPKGWGIVYDAVTHKPVGNAIIRVFEPKYNKLVETTLSDSHGRYSFLLGANEYFVSYSKTGYAEKIVRPVDYTSKHEPTPLALKVELQHQAEEIHASAA